MASPLGLSRPPPYPPPLAARCQIIGMAGTSPAMTKWSCHEDMA